jgi:hypothetical protein
MPYYEDIFPEPGDFAFDPARDISEMIEMQQPGGGDTFSLEDGEATIVYRFDWLKARSFVRWMLGFSYADKGAPWRLRRENPQKHPRFGWLTAVTAHLSSVAPKVNETDAEPEHTPNFPAVTSDGDITKTGFYHETWATVRFVTRKWNHRPDSDIVSTSSEMTRNCYFEPNPSVEMLSIEGPLSQCRWTATGPLGPVVGDPIPTALGTVIARCTHVMHWMHVPTEYISRGNFLFRPRNILECAGFVNEYDFGPTGATDDEFFNKDTILMLAPKFERFRWPLATADGRFPFFGWNVSVPFVEFRPRPRGAANAIAADALVDMMRAARGAARAAGDPVAIAAADAAYNAAVAAAKTLPDGYNLLCWARNRKWFPVERADGATGIYPRKNFLGMFQHIDL